jgi:hypothetical protein
MKKQFLTILSSLPVLILSCNDLAMERIESPLQVKDKSRVERHIPARFETNYMVKKLMEARVRTSGLPLLENGATTFQIRIWQDFQDLTGRSFILRSVNDRWEAELYKYQYRSTDGSLPDSVSGQKLSLPEPRSGWDKYLDKLLDLGVLTLPDYGTIPGYNVHSDEAFITIEVANRNYYRIYEYPDPYYRKDKFPQANAVVDVLKLNEEEFSIK